METAETQYRSGFVRDIPEDNDSRTVPFVISNESRDRHRSIIPLSAWELDNFRTTPIAGWSHEVYGKGLFTKPDPDNFIGRWDNIRIDGDELVGDLTFEDKETNPLAEKLLRKVRNGTLNAVSVGFLPGDGHYGKEEDKEHRGGSKETYYYDSAELIEVSLVGIPSNKDARKKALENGDIPELIEELVREALGDKFIETMTLKGLFATLRGGDAIEVETEDTGEKVDAEARRKRLHKITALNNFLNYMEDDKNGN